MIEIAAVWFIWTLVAFFAGILTYWIATRQQRRLLKKYRQQAKALRFWDKPIE